MLQVIAKVSMVVFLPATAATDQVNFVEALAAPF